MPDTFDQKRIARKELAVKLKADRAKLLQASNELSQYNPNGISALTYAASVEDRKRQSASVFNDIEANHTMGGIAGNALLGTAEAGVNLLGKFANLPNNINALPVDVDDKAIEIYSRKKAIKDLSKQAHDHYKNGLDNIRALGSEPTKEQKTALVASADDMFNKKIAGIKPLSYEDEEYLKQPASASEPETYDDINMFRTLDTPPSRESLLDKQQEAVKDRKGIKELFENNVFRNTVNTYSKDKLNDDLAGIYNTHKDEIEKAETTQEKIKVGAELFGEAVVKIGKDNKLAAVQYAAETLPQLLAGLFTGGAGIAATSAVESADVYTGNLQKYMDDNGGALPTQDKQVEFAQEAMIHFAANYVGDLGVYAGSGVRAINKAAKNAKVNKSSATPEPTTAPTGSVDAPRSATQATDVPASPEQVLLDAAKPKKERSFLRKAATTVGTFAGTNVLEGAAEAVQGVIEEDAFGKDFDFKKDIKTAVTNAAIGAAASTVLTTPKTTGDVVDTFIPDNVGKKAAEPLATPELKDSLNPDEYNEVLDAQAATTNFTKRFEEIRGQDEVSTEDREELRTGLSDLATRKDKIIATAEKALDEYEATTDPEKKAGLENKVKQLTAAVKEINKQYRENRELFDTTVDAKEAVAEVKNAETRDENVSNKISDVVHASLRTQGEQVSAEDAQDMLDSGHLNEQETAHFNDYLHYARVDELVDSAEDGKVKFEGTLVDVNNTFFNGNSNKQKGIRQYIASIKGMLRNENVASAKKTAAALKKTAMKHIEKYKLMQQAYEFRTVDPANYTPEQASIINQLYANSPSIIPARITPKLLSAIKLEAEGAVTATNFASTLIKNATSEVTPTTSVPVDPAIDPDGEVQPRVPEPESTTTPEPVTPTPTQNPEPEQVPPTTTPDPVTPPPVDPVTPTVEPDPVSEPEPEPVQSVKDFEKETKVKSVNFRTETRKRIKNELYGRRRKLSDEEIAVLEERTDEKVAEIREQHERLLNGDAPTGTTTTPDLTQLSDNSNDIDETLAEPEPKEDTVTSTEDSAEIGLLESEIATLEKEIADETAYSAVENNKQRHNDIKKELFGEKPKLNREEFERGKQVAKERLDESIKRKRAAEKALKAAKRKLSTLYANDAERAREDGYDVSKDIDGIRNEIAVNESELREAQEFLVNQSSIDAAVTEALEADGKRDTPETRKRATKIEVAARKETVNYFRTLLTDLRNQLKELTGINSDYHAVNELIEVHKDERLKGAEYSNDKGVFRNRRIFSWISASAKRTLASSTKNVIEAIKRSPNILTQFLPSGTTLSTKQLGAIAAFTSFADQMTPILQNLFLAKSVDFKDVNPQLILGGARGFSSAALASMSGVMFNFLAFEAAGTLAPMDSQIGASVGVSKDNVGRNLRALLATKGVKHTAINTQLGKAVIEAMGFKFDQDLMPSDVEENIYKSVGDVVIAAMIDAGYVTRTSVSVEKVGMALRYDGVKNRNNPYSSEIGTGSKKTLEFITVVGGDRRGIANKQPFEANAPLQAIYDVNQGTDRIIAELFASESFTTKPKLKPEVDDLTVPQLAKRTVKQVATKVREALQHAHKQAYSFVDDMVNIDQLFDVEQFETMLGIIPDQELANMRGLRREEAEAVNATLRLELANMSEWAGDLAIKPKGLKTKFYLKLNAWKQGRIGYDGGFLNPQGSKIQRAFVGQNSWRNTIDKTNAEHNTAFLLAVAQSFGIDIDKQEPSTSLAQLDRLVNSGLFKAGVAGLEALQAGGLSDADMQVAQQNVVALVRSGKENAHTLLGLVNYAKYKNADGSFESTLWTEIDGKTNGVIIGLLQFGHKDVNSLEALVKKGGVLFDKVASFLKLQETAGFDDLYTTLAKSWQNTIKRNLRYATPKQRDDYAFVQSIIGDIKRKLAKDPLMTKIYGVGDEGIKRRFAEFFLVELDTRLEEIINSPRREDESTEDQDKRISYELENMRYLMNVFADTNININWGTTKSQRLNAVIPPALMSAAADRAVELYVGGTQKKPVLDKRGERMQSPLIDAISSLVGFSTAKDVFTGTFVNNRQHINNAIDAINTAFITRYNEVEKERIEDMQQQGLLREGESLPYNEQIAIIDGLQSLIPSLPTSFSISNDDNTQLTKLTRADGKTPKRTYFGNTTNNRTVSAFGGTLPIKQWVQEMGVEAAILYIHSLDANVATKRLGSDSVLSVHDGFIKGVLDAKQLSHDLNSDFHDAMLERDVYADTLTMLHEALDAYRGGYNKLNDEVTRKLNEAIIEVEQVQRAMAESRDAVVNRITQVNQYTYPDGEYVVQELADDGTDSRTLGDESAEQYLDAIIGYEPDTNSGDDRFVHLLANIDQELEVSTGSKPSAKQVIKLALKRAKKDKHYRPTTTKGQQSYLLMQQVVELLPDEVTFSFSDGRADDRQQAFDGDARGVVVGLFNSATNTLSLPLPGTHNVNEVATQSTVLHEMVHALTARAIQLYERDPNTKQLTKEQKAALKKLTALYQETKDAYLSQKAKMSPEVRSEMEYALSNLHEFMSETFASPRMQRFMNGLQTKSRKNLFSEFVRLIGAIMFGNTRINRDSVLANVLREGAIVMDGAKSVAKLKNKGDTHSAMLFSRKNKPDLTDVSTDELFDYLGDNSTTSVEHTERLRTTLRQVVDAVGGIQEEYIQKALFIAHDSVDSFVEHILNNTTPDTTNGSSIFKLTDQEKYVAEMVGAAIEGSIDTNSSYARQLEELWAKARTQLTPESFLADPLLKDDPVSMAQAQEKYDHLFNVTGTFTEKYVKAAGRKVRKNNSTHLVRFASMSAASEDVRGLLSGIDTDAPAVTTSTYVPVVESSFYKKLSELITQMMVGLRDLINGTRNPFGNGTVQLDRMLQNIGRVEHKMRLRATRAQQRKFTGLREAENSANQFVKDAVIKALKKAGEVIKPDENSFDVLGIRHATSALITGSKMTAEGQAGFLFDALEEFAAKSRPLTNFAKSVIREARASTPENQPFMNMLRWGTRAEGDARRVKEVITNDIKERLGENVSESESAAIMRAGIKTDMSTLLYSLPLSRIREVLDSNDSRAEEIQSTLNQLMDYPEYAHYVQGSKALAYFMVTNVATVRNMNFNALQIASLVGTTRKQQAPEGAVALIDKLTSLYAIEYTPSGVRDSMRNGIAKAADKNAFDFILRSHLRLKSDARAKLFQNEAMFIRKGYTSEITNSRITLAQVDASDYKRLNSLLAQGYEVVLETGRDVADLNKQKNLLLAIEDGGMMRYLTGVMQLTDNNRKGTSIIDSAITDKSDYPRFDRENEMYKRLNTTEASKPANVNFDPRNVGEQFMIPTYNLAGNPVDYRYEMGEENRATILQKDYDVAEVLGVMAGNVVTKEEAKKINDLAIDALHEQYTNDDRGRGAKYVRIHENAEDPQLREMWELLPSDAKAQAREKFGGHFMMVKEDVLDLVMGYRKASITDLWKDGAKNNMVQGAIKTALEMTVGRLAGEKLVLRLKQGEEIIQSVVAMIKDSFVVKNVLTTAFNMLSNTFYLVKAGVPFSRVLTDQVEGWRSAQEYNRDRERLIKVDSTLRTMPLGNKRSSMLQERRSIENRLAKNKVAPLMEAGLFSTIAEDIDIENDQLKYKNIVDKSIDRVFDGLPKGVASFGKTMFATQDTKLYKMLNQPIQLSDFSARYALYTYMMEEGATNEAAINEAQDAFVFYDAPTHKGLQYANDTGLLMFSKYYIRIQKQIIKLFADRPATMLAFTLSQGAINIPNIVDSSFITNSITDRLTNPLSAGMDAISEPVLVNLAAHGLGIKN